MSWKTWKQIQRTDLPTVPAMRPCDLEEKKRVKLAVARNELVPICRWEEQGQQDSITV